ncbi:hypothetical protein QJS04_geneDACA001130 [Acorus gramineus]|uniref:Uncharacterized protein n=1 Tax=Acorus gramineus TaxID=55184 RepID=A0AAV9AE58_ACOGR|nr:hypothetical protein QJS04_geneDACA001130 [Acorus gramineus]
MDRDKGPSKRQTKRLSSLTKLAGTSALKAGDVDSPERRKKVKVRGSRRLSKGRSNNGDNEKGEDDLHLPLLATCTSLSSRKRVRLSGKALENCSAIDPASVPRKLRSAMNKRNCDSISIPQPGAKRQHNGFNGTQVPDTHGVRKSRHNLKHHTTTKDEEEVAEALFVLATVLPDSKTSEVDKGMLQEKLELKPTSASLSEGASKEAAQLSSLQEESSGEATKVEESIESALSKQPPILSNDKSNQPFSGTSQIDLQRVASLSRDEHVEHGVPLRDDVNSSDFMIGSPHGLHPCIGPSQPNLTEALPEQTLEIKFSQAWSSSNKSVALSNSMNCSMRLWPTENGFLTGKLLNMPTNTKCGWKRCAIHVHITHLIRSSQSKDKKYQKFKEVTKINDAQISTPSMLKNGSNGVISSGTDNSAVDRAPKDTRLLHDQQESTSSGILSQIVKSCGFQSSSKNVLESVDQMSVPFPLPFISNNHVPPFPTPTHTEPEQISAAAAQQMMQIPQSHGGHDGGGGGSLKQYQEQQQMWQVQLTSYGGRMKLQNCAQSQHIISPPPPMEVLPNPQKRLSPVPLHFFR